MILVGRLGPYSMSLIAALHMAVDCSEEASAYPWDESAQEHLWNPELGAPAATLLRETTKGPCDRPPRLLEGDS